MSGISSKALAFGNPENKLKYNGIEKENDFAIEIYDAQLRELDGQVGVWWQIDPKTENMEMWSPYASNYDNPIRYSDPLGDEGEECCGGIKKYVSELIGGISERAKEYISPEGLFSVAYPGISLSNSLAKDPKGTLNGLAQTAYNLSSPGLVDNAINNPKELGKTGVDAVAVLVTDGVTKAGKLPEKASGYGDLTRTEVKTIQNEVDNAGRPIEIVGSAAKGARRGVDSNMPVGKGPGTKSDIDYIAPKASIKYFDQSKLPSIDPGTGIIPGYHNPFIGPAVRFEPGAKPAFVPEQKTQKAL